MKKVIIIHGYTSSPKKEKYQIIARELDRMGVLHAIPEFPGGARPKNKDWLNIIDREVAGSKGPPVLVGHSLGTRAALLFLDRYGQRVDAVILIAAFDNNAQENQKRQGGNYADFFEYALDIEKIKKLANRFIVVHSKDDNSIPYKQGEKIAKELGAELVTYEDAKHVSEGDIGAERA